MGDLWYVVPPKKGKKKEQNHPETVTVEEEPGQQRPAGGDRNVKFSGESPEERNHRRSREDGGEKSMKDEHDGKVERSSPSGEKRLNTMFIRKRKNNGRLVQRIKSSEPIFKFKRLNTKEFSLGDNDHEDPQVLIDKLVNTIQEKKDDKKAGSILGENKQTSKKARKSSPKADESENLKFKMYASATKKKVADKENYLAKNPQRVGRQAPALNTDSRSGGGIGRSTPRDAAESADDSSRGDGGGHGGGPGRGPRDDRPAERGRHYGRSTPRDVALSNAAERRRQDIAIHYGEEPRYGQRHSRLRKFEIWKFKILEDKDVEFCLQKEFTTEELMLSEFGKKKIITDDFNQMNAQISSLKRGKPYVNVKPKDIANPKFIGWCNSDHVDKFKNRNLKSVFSTIRNYHYTILRVD